MDLWSSSAVLGRKDTGMTTWMLGVVDEVKWEVFGEVWDKVNVTF